MRLVRAAGQNVSPSDDGRLYDQIFSDGLFTETSFASLGADSVRIGAMYGDLCGRDFTIEQQTITVQLPEGEGETTGYIYVEIDLSAETPLSVGSALAPFTPTYEDINVNGAVCQMIVAEYTATALAVTSVTAVYEKAAASSVKAGSIATVENSTATEAHDVGEYILLNGQMYIITAAVSIGETFIEGTNISAVSIGDELTSLNAGLTEWENIPVTVSLSTGSSLTVTCAKRNGIIKFTVDGYKSSSTAAGSNIIRANITGNMGTFAYVCFCAGFYDGSVLVARMESTSATTAELLVRVAGANSAGSDAHVIGICFTELY